LKNRKLLMIPGPIEFEPSVLAAMGMPTTSHVAADFIDDFGRALEAMRQVFLCPDGQPFVLAGSGTLAMDSAGANLVEPGDRVLVVNTGVFSDRFGTLLERYGAQVTHARAQVGDRPSLDEVRQALESGPYKLVTVTHVDTSTGVICDVKALAELSRAHGALLVVDGVCSVAGEELRMSDWGVDLALTASQKAIAVPPGLALLVAGPRAMEAFRARKHPVMSYYSDWSNWLPIMEAYEARKPSYFATPAVNLVWALKTSLDSILAEGMEARFARHTQLSQAFKAAMSALDLKQVPCTAECAAHTLSAVYYPGGVNGPDFLAQVGKAGVILAGGLHPAIRTQYFRIGHMGAANASDVLGTIGAIEDGLRKCGYAFEAGAGLAAAQKAFAGK